VRELGAAETAGLRVVAHLGNDRPLSLLRRLLCLLKADHRGSEQIGAVLFGRDLMNGERREGADEDGAD